MDLSHNFLESFDEIHSIPSLISIDVTYNQISDISKLNHPNLRRLSIGCNPLRDFSPLIYLPDLEVLDLYKPFFNSFDQLSFIRSLKYLKYLNLFSTQIENFETFGMRNLFPALKIQKYNDFLKRQVDMVFGDNEELIISCRLGEGSKSHLFSKLLTRPHFKPRNGFS